MNIKTKISEFKQKFEQYNKMADMKKEQYQNYLKTINKRVDEYYYQLKKQLEKQANEKQQSNLYLELI